MTGEERPVVVVEDDHELRNLIVRGLRAAGFAATGLATGADLLRRLERAEPDLVVLDVGLPDADGLDVCMAIRARGYTAPVIFLTARDAVGDRVGGFDAGADDYLTKPFAMVELVARARALVRRAGANGASAPDGAIALDPTRHGVAVGDASCDLTPTEFRVLAALVARPAEAVRRRALVAAGWPHGAIVSDNSLDAVIARIRRKLRRLPGAPEVVTVHGVGYRVAP